MLEAAQSNIQASVQKLVARRVKKGEIDQGEAEALATATMSRLSFEESTTAIRDVDLVVEAIVENMDVKLKFYDDLGRSVNPRAIFASNTSSLRITPLAEASHRPAQFVGLHYFNPYVPRAPPATSYDVGHK